jgi:Uri superfamily endonuclease
MSTSSYVVDSGVIITMSIFTETMTKAISDYRLLLRRYLKQAERMAKLRELKLQDSDTYVSDVSLYDVGYAIVEDIEKNMTKSTQGYYSYSGIQQFSQHVREYLDNYYIENNQVVHRAQKASRALLKAIQMTTLPRERLNEEVAKMLLDCNITVVNYGSSEQCDLQLQTLSRQQENNPGFYTRIIAHLESLISSGDRSVAA